MTQNNLQKDNLQKDIPKEISSTLGDGDSTYFLSRGWAREATSGAGRASSSWSADKKRN
jgi:hypothetical protein